MGLVVAAATLGGVLGLFQRSSMPTGLEVVVDAPPAADDSHQTSETRIRVHVGGWVAQPTVVVLADDALVADAIRAAGGALPGADLDSINLAQRRDDGAHVIVPGPGASGVGPGEFSAVLMGGFTSTRRPRRRSRPSPESVRSSPAGSWPIAKSMAYSGLSRTCSTSPASGNRSWQP